MSPQPITHPALALPGIDHGFFTRRGGVSTGLYDSLNVGLGSADDPDRVRQNRARVAASLGLAPERLVTVYQVHSARAVTVEARFADRGVEADALVTREPGLALGVLTADCAPVLLADPAARVIGAAHAGWKGALNGVIEATVEAMAALGAEPGRILAVVGPTIGPFGYEVSEGFETPFLLRDSGAERFFSAGDRPGKLRFNLPAYVVWRLSQSGVPGAVWTGHDTCAQRELFFSNRRAYRAGEPDFGRLISAIALR